MSCDDDLLDMNEFKAAEMLFENSFFKEAIVIYWQLTRSLVFDVLFRSGVEFNSTKEALKKMAMINVHDMDLVANIYFLETVATLAEWDNCFSISSDDAKHVRDTYSQINRKIISYV